MTDANGGPVGSGVLDKLRELALDVGSVAFVVEKDIALGGTNSRLGGDLRADGQRLVRLSTKKSDRSLSALQRLVMAAVSPVNFDPSWLLIPVTPGTCERARSSAEAISSSVIPIYPAKRMRSGESCTRPVTPAGKRAVAPWVRTDSGIPQMGHFGTSPFGS